MGDGGQQDEVRVGEQLLTMTKDNVKTGTLQGGGGETRKRRGMECCKMGKWHQEKGYHI